LKKRKKKEINNDALTQLKSYQWTGNVRELRNVVERLVILCDQEIKPEDVKKYTEF
jgi:two-component system, NtrC family, nitrogen regulation response regulator NtrX